MLAERAESRRVDAALAILLRQDIGTSTTSTTSDDDGDTKFLEPEEISRRILKHALRGAGAVGSGSTYQSNVRITVDGYGEVQTGNVVVLFSRIRRSEDRNISNATIFGNASGFGITEAKEENVPE